MSNVVAPLQVPVTAGTVRAFAQVRIEIAGLSLPGGIASVMRKRIRNREMVYGNNVDPTGKTSGQNAYEATADIYYDWYAVTLATIRNNFGPGYGDQSFDMFLTFVGLGNSQGNLPVYRDVLKNCTFDNDEMNAQKGTSPLAIGIHLNPTKIYFAIPDGASHTDPLYDDNPDPLDLQTG